MSLKNTITDFYGGEVYRNVCNLQKLKQKSAITKNQWIFMQRCLSNNVLPKSFKTRPTLNTRKGWNITKNYNYAMLNAAKNESRNKYHQLLKKIKTLENDLQLVLTNEDFEKATQITEKSRENNFVKKRTSL